MTLKGPALLASVAFVFLTALGLTLWSEAGAAVFEAIVAVGIILCM